MGGAGIENYAKKEIGKMRYSYEAAQKEFVSFHNLKEGDTVKILRKAGIGELGWYHWVPSMDKYVGKTGVVRYIRDRDKFVGNGIDVKTGKEWWNYPFYVLEKVKSVGEVELAENDYSYEEAQEEFIAFHSLKVGDKVKVLRTAKTKEMGWAEHWFADKDLFVGKVGIYKGNNGKEGLRIDVPDLSWHTFRFPFFVLEKVADVGAAMSTNYSYEEAQKEFVKFHNLKAGDKVKILRKSTRGEMGWEVLWSSRMDTAVGKTAEVIDISSLGVMTKEPGSNLWIYPFFVLEKI